MVLGFIFLTAATAIGIFLPIWEARDLFFRVGSPRQQQFYASPLYPCPVQDVFQCYLW